MAKIDLTRRAEIYDEKRNRTRNVLMKAAMVVFSEKGIDGATTEDLIREAGVSRGTLYNYFTDMEDVVETVATNLVEELTAEIMNRYRRETPADECLANTMASYLCKAREDKSWGGVVVHLALKNAPLPVGAMTAIGLTKILQLGKKQDCFRFHNIRVAEDIVTGASLYALKTVVDKMDQDDYIVDFLEGLLLALGTTPKRARNAAAKAILPQVT